MRDRGKILVVRGGAIGDFILTLPVLAALRAQFPETHLEVLGYPHIARLALLAGSADAVRPIEARPLARFFARGGELDETWRDYFGQFSIVLSFLYDPDGVFRTNLTRCGVRHFIEGPHRPEEAGTKHAAHALLEPLSQLAIFNANTHPRIVVPGLEAGGSVRLALHPGSGGVRKNWPFPAWLALARAVIRETDWRLVVVGGEAEGEVMSSLAEALPKDRCEFHLHLPLEELARVLAGSALFVGHDSGITHLAAAVGLPCLVLWGPTNEHVWRPLGSAVRLLRHDAGLSGLPVETVYQQIVEMMNHRV
ncbi:MAG: glycosyltransferase family 9 protein [Verrucomicrobia bacterium]|nr:glycosyltransferase family 9 protein [Verrucomicrobiota bacterium]